MLELWRSCSSHWCQLLPEEEAVGSLQLRKEKRRLFSFFYYKFGYSNKGLKFIYLFIFGLISFEDCLRKCVVFVIELLRERR